jgi:hypothetical protein
MSNPPYNKKLDTSPIHSLYSGDAVYQLKPIPNNSGAQYIYKKEYRTMLIHLILAASALFVGLSDDTPIWAIGIIGVIAAGLSFITAQFKNQVLIFNTNKNEFYKLNKKSQERSENIPFKNIEALQLLHYTEVSSDNYNRDAYELNLILKNRRVNLVAHSDYKRIKKDAKELSHLLGVPIKEND